jgi:hypothetical protein
MSYPFWWDMQTKHQFLLIRRIAIPDPVHYFRRLIALSWHLSRGPVGDSL